MEIRVHFVPTNHASIKEIWFNSAWIPCEYIENHAFHTTHATFKKTAQFSRAIHNIFNLFKAPFSHFAAVDHKGKAVHSAK